MASKIQELLSGKTDKIDYEAIIKKHEWIVEKNHYCILSPDSDGLLCGLFMSKYLGWKVVGFYDGKVAVINKKYKDKNPIFLDMEIFRKEIRSIGHHMVLLNKKHLPENWDNFNNCIQPNNMRKYDGKNNFRLKYPLATIHLLVGIVSKRVKNIKLPESAIPPLFFTDGVFNVLFKYPENVLNWLSYLRINEDWHPLKSIFENDKYTVFTLMNEMNEFFRKRDEVSVSKERGDRLRISNKDGTSANIEGIKEGNCSIHREPRERIISFMKILSDLTRWSFNSNDWDCWDNMKFYQFKKGDFTGDKQNITNANFRLFMAKKPLSWAMTSGTNIEYTLEEPDKLL
ncbi:MAG: hypothetical protein AABY07_01465 [Nanoarchaeota archaeon]